MDLNVLQSKIKGHVLTAESDGYDEARTPWELSIEQRPRIIVMVKDTEDILTAVRFSRENGLKVGVKNTGHGISLPADDNMLIVVSDMKDVRIDPEKRTARVEAGAEWKDVLEMSQDVGLAPLLGSSSTIGAVGYTLGGGMGWLARKYGLAQNSVISYEMVTANGKLITVSQEENPDLFWALKGAGAAFGIITAMEIKLYPVEIVYAGTLFYAPSDAKEVFSRYRDWSSKLNDDWTTSIGIGNFPDDPVVPDLLRGKSLVMVRGCYDGTLEKGEREIQGWLDWKAPLANLFGPLPFRMADMISMDPKDPLPAMLSNMILSELSDEVIDSLVRWSIAGNGPHPLLITEIHQGGGALAIADRSQMPNNLQDAPYVLKFIGIVPNPDFREMFIQLLSKIRSEIQPYCTGGSYLNFLSGEEKWNSARTIYSVEALERLATLKQIHDPENLLSYSMNLSVE